MLGIILLGLSIVGGNMDVREMEFERVQSEWVAELYHPDQILDVLPIPFHYLFSNRYKARQNARKAIHDMRYGMLRYLVLASKHPDPNLHMMAESLLRDLYNCESCNGTGTCPVEHKTQEEYHACRLCSYLGRCKVCEGSGDIRYIHVGQATRYRSDIFPERKVAE